VLLVRLRNSCRGYLCQQPRKFRAAKYLIFKPQKSRFSMCHNQLFLAGYACNLSRVDYSKDADG
jgi:hypothetical protein